MEGIWAASCGKIWDGIASSSLFQASYFCANAFTAFLY
jgi:hypothetical protein